MNIARIGLLAVAVLAAGGAAFLVRSMTHKEVKAKTVAVEAPANDVLVAARALEPGTVLTAADLRWQKWPQEAVNQSYFTSKTSPKATEENTGAIVRSHVEPGEPLTAAKFLKAKDAGFMAAILSSGMRAMSVKIGEESAAGGFILPGDQVDVVLTHKVEDGGPDTFFSAETILENVRVLAIDQKLAPSGDDKSLPGNTATLELTPRQVELVSAAQATGEISLALRSAATGDITGSTGLASSRGNTIRIVRYAHARRATPALAQSSGGAP
jgi:pilus assembly protein CpaB